VAGSCKSLSAARVVFSVLVSEPTLLAAHPVAAGSIDHAPELVKTGNAQLLIVLGPCCWLLFVFGMLQQLLTHQVGGFGLVTPVPHHVEGRPNHFSHAS